MTRLIASGEIKAVEAVEAAISRAERVNPSINAIASDNFESALNRVGEPVTGPFGGVPSFIKDTDDVEGLPTRYGSRAVSGGPAGTSSEFVRQYDAMGFICLGKSTLPEMGLTGTTEPLSTGPTRNPWSLDHSTGGSSGGAAALVASGIVPMAHGNDGGGSIRIPAACCGLVGLKPSRGRLPDRAGSNKMPINVVCDGVLTRSVRDTAAFYAASEIHFRNPRLPEIGLVSRPGKQRYRIGLIAEPLNYPPEDAGRMEQVVKTAGICEELGHRVEEIPFPFHGQVMDDFFIYWAFMAFSVHRFGEKALKRPVDKDKLEKFTKGLSRHYLKNIYKTPFVIRRLRRFAHRYEELFDRYDILLSLTTSGSTPRLGHLHTELDFDTAFDRLKRFIPYTAYQNIAGAPAVSLPLGHCGNGLPIGVQFAAPVGEEKRLLELALELEETGPWPRVGDDPNSA